MINTTITTHNIKAKLIEQLSIYYLDIADDSQKHIGHNKTSEGGHYTIMLVSNVFNKMKLIDRHKLIYKILDNMIGTEIHAISIKAYSIKEYKSFRNYGK